MTDETVLNELLKDKLKDSGIKEKNSGTDQIVCIVDRSGSMRGIHEDAQGGLNTFIEEQKTVGKAKLTIIDFDNTLNVVCDQIDIKESAEYKLVPRGGTALLDAIGSVISEFDKYETKDGKTIVIIITDGNENASKEWKHDAIFEMIAERKEAGWEFMFMASGQDAIKVGSSYGFDANSTMSFSNSGKGVATAYGASSVYTTALRTHSKEYALAAKTQVVSANADVLSETGDIKKDK